MDRRCRMVERSVAGIVLLLAMANMGAAARLKELSRLAAAPHCRFPRGGRGGRNGQIVIDRTVDFDDRQRFQW